MLSFYTESENLFCYKARVTTVVTIGWSNSGGLGRDYANGKVSVEVNWKAYYCVIAYDDYHKQYFVVFKDVKKLDVNCFHRKIISMRNNASQLSNT